MNYGLSYREKHNLDERDLTDAQSTLHYIAENMRMEKSISEDGYRYFQQAIEALEPHHCEDAISREAVKEILAKYHLGESRIMEELNELSSVQRTSNAKKHVENTLEDAISRTRLKEVFHRNVVCGEAYDELIDAQPPVTVQANKEDIHREREQAYMCGYEDASRKYRIEPCEDAISRQAVDKLIDELARAISYERCFVFRGRNPETIMQDILDLPAVSTEKTGRWIDIQSHWSDLTRFQCTCDQCGDFSNKITPFCPNCGAKMGVEE